MDDNKKSFTNFTNGLKKIITKGKNILSSEVINDINLLNGKTINIDKNSNIKLDERSLEYNNLLRDVFENFLYDHVELSLDDENSDVLLFTINNETIPESELEDKITDEITTISFEDINNPKVNNLYDLLFFVLKNETLEDKIEHNKKKEIIKEAVFSNRDDYTAKKNIERNIKNLKGGKRAKKTSKKSKKTSKKTSKKVKKAKKTQRKR